MWHYREAAAAWRAILLDRRPRCARVAVMPGSCEAPSKASAVLQGESPRHRAVGRGFQAPPTRGLTASAEAAASLAGALSAKREGGRPRATSFRARLPKIRRV